MNTLSAIENFLNSLLSAKRTADDEYPKMLRVVMVPIRCYVCSADIKHGDAVIISSRNAPMGHADCVERASKAAVPAPHNPN